MVSKGSANGNEKPSDPKAREVPRRGFQLTRSVCCTSAVPESNPASKHQERISANDEEPSATARTRCGRSPGSQAISGTPSTGEINSNAS